MQFTRLRIIAAALLLLFAGGGAFAYFKYKKISNYLIGQINGQTSKKFGRQVKFKSISFSPLKGIIIREACVSRRPDFSKGSFFCAAKTVIRPQLTALIRNKIYFSRVAFEKPVLKVRERDGAWDFADLLALIPETDKGLYLTWNASELSMSGATLEADLETSGLSLALENADISLEHYSSFGGNYGLSAEGLVKTVLKGKLLSAEVKIKTDANFDYGGLSSTKGALSAQNLSYGAMTLESFKTDWTLFNLRKPLADKNYSIALNAEKLLIPGQETSIREGVSKGLALFSAAMGRTAPKIEDIEMSSLTAAFRLDNSALALKDLELRTNFMDLSAGLAIDGPAKTAEAGIDAAIGSSRIKLSASGPMASPRLMPALSATLAGKLKEALANAENGLLKLFPVTGE
ncbi:MAG: hypothetical protein PHV36_03265 [Elusimicrobiales bacterium]|nr:hypothetical protein [Elusimicrobiales bacterium]